MKKSILIIGGGFAGFWSAISAARQAKTLSKTDDIQITLINTDQYLTIRPRLYEASLEGLQVNLYSYLSPLGIQLVQGKVFEINPLANQVSVSMVDAIKTIPYDYLILTAGSALRTADIAGFEHTFNVDQYLSALKLENHLINLLQQNEDNKASKTIVVVGAGFTGLETATSIREKMKLLKPEAATQIEKFRVVIVEKSEHIAPGYSDRAVDYIEERLENATIESFVNVSITQINKDSITLSNGVTIPTKTVIWTAGMRASFLTQFFSSTKDDIGRLVVDQHLKLPNYPNVIVAGDVAKVQIDDIGNSSVQACQFSIYQGKWAGHNAINDLFDQELKPYKQPNYVTCLDLGGDDALLTVGWDREIQSVGKEAKKLKMDINRQWIYPMPKLEDTLEASFPGVPSM